MPAAPTRRVFLAGIPAAVSAVCAPPLSVPDRLVVLTFDDGPVSHATYVAPLLKKYGFGATFFVCEFPPHFNDKTMYMSWEQMASLHQMGFEVGNHTIAHRSVTRLTREQFAHDLHALEEKAYALGVPKMISFAYPGYAYNRMALEVLKESGYLFARAGFDRTYDPKTDDRYLIPGFTVNDHNHDETLNVIRAAAGGRICVLTFHGVPDKEHPWVNTRPEQFEEYLELLKRNRYTVIAMRDVQRYVAAAG